MKEYDELKESLKISKKMWTVIKFNKSNLEFLKKDLSRQLGKDLKIYFPRIFIQNYKKKQSYQ